jgi:DNA repair exonuclease SbcCD nuclease subunit
MKKIFGIADFQIFLAGKNIEKLQEYEYVFNEFIGIIKEQKPDIITMLGDIFEVGSDTNPLEESLFISFVEKISKLVTEVVIIGGNHDYKQQNNWYVSKTSGVKTPILDRINVIFPNEKKDKRNNNIKYVRAGWDNVFYLEKTGFYGSEIDDDIVYCVWGHRYKFHSYLKPIYNPFSLKGDIILENGEERLQGYKRSEHLFVELFHDPIDGYHDFLDRVSFGQKYSLSDFKGDLIIAGDIHKPNIYNKINGTKFCYCSSLVIRNFKEGDYYKNNVLSQDGNILHGYMQIEIKDKPK